MPNSKDCNPKRILLVCTKHTGSNLFCSPAIRLVRDQLADCRIEVVALSNLSSEVFIGNSDIDVLHVATSRRQVRKLTRHIDVALCLNPKSADLLIGTECPVQFVPAFLGGRHQADAILEFVAATLGLTADQSHRHYVMAKDDLPTPLTATYGKLIGLHLGCGRTAIQGWKFWRSSRGEHRKLWPLDRYIRLGKLLKEHYPGFHIAITGTRNEAFLGKQFVEAQPDTINLIGQTTAQSLFAAIERMDAFVTHDCGVLHIASATNTPIISIFSSTSPEETGPYPSQPNRVILQSDNICEIEPEHVIRHLDKLFHHRRENGLLPDQLPAAHK